MTKPPRESREGGFTLVEVLVAIVIEAMIVAALGAAFIGILKTSSQVKTSLSQSGDARIAAAYIVSDASNSSGPEISLTDTTSCPDSSPPVAGTATPVVRFDSSETSSAGVATPDIVIYYIVSGNLIRRECQNGSLTSDSIVARNVATVTATCSPAADCSATPTSITVTVTEAAASDGSQYQYSLTGTFQKLIGDGAPTPTGGPTQSIILLGSGATCGTTPAISITSSATMKVYGSAYINTADNGTTCTSMSVTSSGSFTAGSTNILTGGTCKATSSGICPSTITPYSPAIADPYAALAAPSTAGMTARSGCPGGIAQPGVYASQLSIVASATCQMQPGVYVLQAGLAVTSSGKLTYCSACANPGVLIYITGGSIQTNSSGSINIAAQTTGAYAGLVIWQAKTDTSSMSFTSSGSLNLDGYIYAPTAQLSLNSSASNPTVTGIVAQSITMSSSSNIVIGVPPTITSTALDDGEQTVGYSNTLTATGGDTPYTWSITSGALQAGLTLNASTGVISGTPTASGTVTLGLSLADSGGNHDTASVSLTIDPGPSISSTSPLPGGDKTVAYSTTLTGASGSAPYTWALTSGTLPAGLTLNTSTGVISGTPTGTATSTFTIQITDAGGATASKSLSLTTSAAPTISTTSPLTAGEKTAPYSLALAGTGGTTPYAWSISTGTLPAGLTLSPAGVISGTPTATATNTSVTYELTDAAGATVTKAMTITIAAQPTVKSVTLANKTGGAAGKIEAGDKITIVYNSAMSVAGFCNTWSGDTTSQTLTGNGVLVNLIDGGSGNDSLTVTNSVGCAFNFGTLTLNSTAYVTANASLGGASGNTTIAWTASTKTMVITFGASTATFGSVTSASASYAPSILQVDTGNGQLVTPFAVAAAKQF